MSFCFGAWQGESYFCMHYRSMRTAVTTMVFTLLHLFDGLNWRKNGHPPTTIPPTTTTTTTTAVSKIQVIAYAYMDTRISTKWWKCQLLYWWARKKSAVRLTGVKLSPLGEILSHLRGAHDALFSVGLFVCLFVFLFVAFSFLVFTFCCSLSFAQSGLIAGQVVPVVYW